MKVLLAQFDFTPLTQRFSLDDLLQRDDVLIARSATNGNLVIYDAQLRPRVELEVAAEKGFESRGGQEYPVNGLRVLRVNVPAMDSETLQTHKWINEPFLLPPRC